MEVKLHALLISILDGVVKINFKYYNYIGRPLSQVAVWIWILVGVANIRAITYKTCSEWRSCFVEENSLKQTYNVIEASHLQELWDFLNSNHSTLVLCILVLKNRVIEKSRNPYCNIYWWWHFIQFDWINKHTISLWLYKRPRKSRHVVTCSRQSVIFQLSFNSRSARMSFSQVQQIFVVEHYLASRSYLTCQNKFRDKFPDSPVPNNSTISRIVNRFRDTGTLHRVE
jgi:hypothetical protein